MASLTTKPLCQHGFIFPMISTPLPAKFKLPIQTFALHCTYKNNLVMIKCENSTAINQTIKAPFFTAYRFRMLCDTRSHIFRCRWFEPLFHTVNRGNLSSRYWHIYHQGFLRNTHERNPLVLLVKGDVLLYNQVCSVCFICTEKEKLTHVKACVCLQALERG